MTFLGLVAIHRFCSSYTRSRLVPGRIRKLTFVSTFRMASPDDPERIVNGNLLSEV